MGVGNRSKGMKRSKIVIPLHLVWTTKNRERWITSEIEERLYRALYAKSEELKVTVLTIGGMPDHVHIAVLFPATLTVANFVKQLKGVSQTLASDVLLGHRVLWQEGYGAFAFQIGLQNRVIHYIQNQKEHHNQSSLWPILEITDEEVP